MELDVYQSGNTIRFLCTFRDFEGEITDPDIVKIIFYDYSFSIIEEAVLGDANKDVDGSYFYDFTTPTENQTIHYEWYGEINGLPAIKRDSFLVKFIR